MGVNHSSDSCFSTYRTFTGKTVICYIALFSLPKVWPLNLLCAA